MNAAMAVRVAVAKAAIMALQDKLRAGTNIKLVLDFLDTLS